MYINFTITLCNAIYILNKQENQQETRKAKKNKQTVWVRPSSQTDNQEKAGNQHGLSPFFPLAMLNERPLYQQTHKHTNRQTNRLYSLENFTP